MARTMWDRCLRLLVSASLVVGLVPTNALAEAIEEPTETTEGYVMTEGELVSDEGVVAANVDLPKEAPAGEEAEDEALAANAALAVDAAPVVDESAADDSATSDEPALQAASQKSLENASVTITVDYLWLGEPIGDAVIVTDETGARLTEGVDFRFEYYTGDWELVGQTPSEPGYYFLRVVALDGSGYTGETYGEYVTVTTRSIERISYSGSSVYAYTGQAVEPNYEISDCMAIHLVEGVDYQWEYLDANMNVIAGAPSEPGDYYVRAVAIQGGQRTGTSYTLSFIIRAANSLEIATVAFDRTRYPETGEPVKVEYVVTAFDGTTLREGIDYELVFQHLSDDETGVPYKQGSYNVAARAIEGGGYSGGTGFEYFEIGPANDLSFMRLEVPQDTYTCTGEAVTPEVVITDGHGNQLAADTDYQVVNDSVDEPIQSGYYRFKAIALEGGGYVGETETFYIYLEAADSHGTLQLDQLSRAAAHSYAAWIGEFTAPEDGTYRFAATSGNASYGGLYADEELSYRIAYNDNWQGLFSFDVELSSGQTVYLHVRSDDAELDGQVTVKSVVVDPYDLASAYAYMSSECLYVDGYATFLYQGAAITPSVQVSAEIDGNYRELIEGTDYLVSYQDNNAVTDEGATAQILLTGIGDFHGSQSIRFRIVDSFDLQQYLTMRGARVIVGSKSTFYNIYEENEPTYLVTGAAIKPLVQFNPGAPTPASPKDFTVSYSDLQGTPVTRPVEPGQYQIVLTATEGGMFRGSATIPFSIVATRSIDGATVYPDSGVRYETTSSYNEWCLYTIYGVDDLSQVAWRITEPNDYRNVLVEGVDYVVNAQPAQSPVPGLDAYTVTFEGIGKYTGTATLQFRGSYDYGTEDLPVYVCVSPTAEDEFKTLNLYVNGSIYATRVYLDAEGNLQQPDLHMEGLVEGVDFRFSHFEDLDGNTITTAAQNDGVITVVEGMGKYEGLTRRSNGSTASPIEVPDVNSYSVWMAIKNAFSVFVDQDTAYYLLKDQTPDVWMYVYGTHSLLHEGQGFSVHTSLAADGNSMVVTATGTDTSIMQGSHSRTLHLVDKFDLSLLSSCDIALNNGAVGDESVYSSWYGTPAKLAYAGFSYMPTATLLVFGDEFPNLAYDVTLLGADGSAVSAVTGPGSYTAVLTGTGDWTGTLTAPFEVYEADEGIDIASCTATLGVATLEGGAAEPTVTLTYGDHQFAQGTDFVVEYGNNTAPGAKAFAKLTGVSGGSLCGSKTVTFEVPPAGKDFSQGYTLQIIDYQQADTANHSLWHNVLPVGTELEADDVVVLDPYGNAVDASAYDIECHGFEAPGTALVTVTGKGEYTGTLSANYVVADFVNKTSIVGATVTGAKKTYTGKAQSTTVTVKVDGKTLVSGTDFKAAYRNNTKAGTATITVTGIGDYVGTATGTFTIAKASLATTNKSVQVAAIADQAYTGKARTPALTVKLGAVTLKAGTDYTVSYKNNVKVGTATATITGKGSCSGSRSVTFKIVKGTNPVTAKATKATVQVAYAKVKSANQVLASNLTVSKAQGKITYAKVSGSASILVNKTTGKITVKKGLKAGTYTVKVKATAAGNANYKSGSKTVAFKVKVYLPNTLTAVRAKASVTASLNTLKSKNQVIGPNITVSGAKGAVTYAKSSGAAAFTVNAKTGKVTVKKGTKKGTYTIKVKVTAAGTTTYAAKSVIVTYKIAVK